ncbi:MAG TPA: diguanylate cyclase, partial [Coriobacteriia bacterium]|nr:diguanylate cyclase [Coriobacteriia bacterium]
MGAGALVFWWTIFIDVAAIGAVLFVLGSRHTSRRQRAVAIAFLAACAVGVGIPILLFDGLVVPPMVLAALVGVQVASVTGGVWLLRLEVGDLRRKAELAKRARAARTDYADCPTGVVGALAPDGTVRYMNRRGLELIGLPEDQVIGRDAFELWGTDGAERCGRSEFRKFCRTLGQSGGVVEYPVRTVHGDRTMRWTRSAVLDADGGLIEVISYGEDVTDQRETEEQLRFESYLLDSVQDSVLLTTVEGRVLYLNEAAHLLRGYTREEFLALEPLAWIAPESMEETLVNRRRTLETGSALYEALNATKADRRIPFEVRSQLVTYKGEPAILNVSRDISARKRTEALMSQMAFNDPLTGLPNRRLVSERLRAALARLDVDETLNVAVVYVDIDELKVVNDTAGHDAGDQMIKIMAERLRHATREEDTLGRIGGDEFVLLLPNLDSRSLAEDVARRLLASVAEAVIIDGVNFRPSASIGICYGASGMSASEAIKRADRAMYVAKQAGGSRFEVYDTRMDAAVSERFRLRNELAAALDASELEIDYQLMVDTRSGKVSGIEALVRWRHPERGRMMPDEFIGIAEESSLIVPIGRWVLFEACAALARWRSAGLRVPRVCVNLSAVQLTDGDLCRDVSEALAFAGLEPRDLELEVTETAMMSHVAVAAPVLEELSAMGVSL